MPLSELTDPTAINAAMDEFDTLGRDNFLKKYGFRPSRSYFVMRATKRYDSKAIVGAAFAFQHPQRGHLRPDQFNGGDDTVRALLEKLGFQMEVEIAQQRPSLTARDLELIRPKQFSREVFRLFDGGA